MISQPEIPRHLFPSVRTLRTATALVAVLLMVVFSAGSARAGEWKRATETDPMEFPRDHFSHPEYKTEWWYFTGNLEDESGAPVGYQFTLFRHGIIPPTEPGPDSQWAARQIGFGHAAISLPASRDFHFAQVLERGSLGSAEFPVTTPSSTATPASSPALLARVKSWKVSLLADGAFHLLADFDGHALDLHARPMVEAVLQGNQGLSQKSAGEGNASRYYSIPRLETTGTVTTGGKTLKVRGTSWLDREWASNQLGPEQIGWDWFALRFDDGRDLMVYQMRRKDGTRDPFSHGSLRKADGSVVHLGAKDFQLTPGRTWKSPVTGGDYPVAWELVIPGEEIKVTITALQDKQELALQPVSYYEGAVKVTSAAGPVGQGYMELTGYANPLEALRDR